MNASLARLFAPLFVLLCAAGAAQDEPADPFAALAARSIGPAGMSGRVAAIDVVHANPNVIYVGAATGGLWKTTDGGLGWTPLFDDQPVASIGAVAIHQVSPEIVWVGSGEGNPRNSSSVGRGVWRTLDAGATWTRLGLENTEKITRVILHPSDPDVAWVAALGTTWGENEQRGVFKTTDGGASWDKVLYVDERTGCADLELDPVNPNKLVAAMWEHRRRPDFFHSGGPGSGLYLSRDGGATWTRKGADDGLPSGDLGRIGLAISRSNPDVVYALVEAEQSALVRSDDGGRSFRTVNSEASVASRPFYYADIRVDPADSDRVYSLASTVTYSTDGGASFDTLIPWSLIHPDHHAMWIHPDDPNHIIEGNDGGVAISRDRGNSWRFVRNLPLAQFYHVDVDMDFPFHVYGGMQDNGSWRGPSTVWENGGIRNHHWDEVGFGDGFRTVPMPDDSSRGYAMSQGGALMRWNNVTGGRKSIPPPAPEDVELRFNWNAGLALHPSDPDTLYYGSQFVHRSTDRGDTWEIISGDLTTNNSEWQRQAESGGLTPDVTAAENFTSILVIAPSLLDPKVIWVGTDDGRLHLTRDEGATWLSLEANLFGVPRNTWIPHVEASKHDAAVAYVVLDDHRRANWTTYVFKTSDYGATWTSLATADLDGYAHTIEEDPVDPELLFLGTEFGLFLSRDGGESWAKWTAGVPTVGVRALVVHPRDHDLVIGTHGRAAYVIDDVRPLRARPVEALDATIYVAPIPPVVLFRTKQTAESRFPGSEEFRGQARSRAAQISFWVAEPSGDPAEVLDEITLEILTPDGNLVRSAQHDVHAGLNRIRWDLRHKGFRTYGSEGPSSELGGGPEALPGKYVARIHYGETVLDAELDVRADPRVQVPMPARLAKFTFLMQAGKLNETYGDVRRRIDRTRADLELIRAKADQAKDPDADEDAPHPHAVLVDAMDAIEEQLDALEKKMFVTEGEKGIPSRTRVSNKVGSVFWRASGSWDAPTDADKALVREARTALQGVVDELNPVLGEQLAALREKVEEAGLKLLAPAEPISID
ncbi:MAG: hypothetical protein GY711_07510 [bacterium]|nr:hypothetical protein [bacterium]